MSIRTESFVAPLHWAPALINDDYTGIDDDNEVERIERFAASLPGPVVDAESVGIMHGVVTDTPDQLDGDYAEYTCNVYD